MVPTVAIVVPAYNAASTLAVTLASVSAQTLTNFEAVIVDDGSSDETFEIASSVAARDQRFRVIRQPNGGVADARNAGILASTAPLVAPLDADDLWHPRFLESLSTAIHTGGSDTVFAYANSRVIDASDHVIGGGRSYGHEGWVLNRLLLVNFVANGSAMMFRREHARHAGLYERRLHHEFGEQGAEDWLLALRLAARGRVAAVREFLVGYRSLPDAMSRDVLRMRRSRRRALELFSSDTEPASRPAMAWSLGAAHGKCFLSELRDGQIRAACHSFLAALRLDPLGTADLLVGAERLRWIKAFNATADANDLSRFAEQPTIQIASEPISSRLARAREWDARITGPAALRSLAHVALARK